MTPNLGQPRQAIQNARTALRRGDMRTARRWAELAASLAPDQEEPWLILAAVASRRASIAYLERALKINPHSRRAHAGMRWARQRLGAQPGQAHALTRKAAAGRRLSLPLVLLSIIVAAVAWAAWPGTSSTALASILGSVGAPAATQAAPFAEVDVAKPTYTPTPTLTPSPTPTFTATPIPTETSTAEPTWTPWPTEAEAQPEGEPIAFTPGDTYVVQAGDTLNQIALQVGVSLEVLATANNIVDPAAIYAGQRLVIPQGGYIPPESAPSYPAGEKRILVDISEQHLYAYQGDALVYSFVASTGMNNATRVGTFSVLSKIPNAYGATWNIWMPNWLGIYWAGGLQNGIHALPILPGGRRLWAGYLGTPISYGCVVLGVNESQLLYDWAEVGTLVEIQW